LKESNRYALIHRRHVLYLKYKLASFAAAQHNALVSSNFCKELDLARFYQRAFFCPDFELSWTQAAAKKRPGAQPSCYDGSFNRTIPGLQCGRF
jgi:hypothetical protein